MNADGDVEDDPKLSELYGKIAAYQDSVNLYWVLALKKDLTFINGEFHDEY